MGAVTLTLVGFFAFVMIRLSQPRMTTLFADLAPAETAAITRELDTRNIKYEIAADGGVLRVPQDQAARLRMDLAAKGMPGGGTVGYEVFDKADAFSTTATVQNVNKLRALEGELARSIRTIDRVQAARVHLSIPERRLFAKDKTEPRASIVLKVRGELDSAQVRAVRHLVASAVDGLKPGRISLVDEGGRLLADGAGDENDTVGLIQDRQTQHERRLRSEVEDIVASIVGRGRARVQVSVELDANRIVQTSENFDPESRVVRSAQTRSEQNASSEARDGQVTVGNEVPGAQRGNAGQPTQKEQKQTSEETTNYEISRTTRTETNDGGKVKRLSVAVLVDGTYAKGSGGEVNYTPRTDEDLQRIATLVRLGVGFDKNRGDQIEVVNLRFAEQPAPDALPDVPFMTRMLTFSHDDLMRLAEAGVLLVMTLIVLFFVVRPLLRQVTAPLLAEILEAPKAVLSAPPSSAETAPSASAPNALPQLETVGQLVATRPDEAAAILKSWMRQP